MGLSKMREKWAGASGLQNQINNVTNQQLGQAQAVNPYAVVTTGGQYTVTSSNSATLPVTPMPYPPTTSYSSTEMILLLTLMYTVGPDVAKRLIRKFELNVDNELLEKISDGIKEINSDTNDLDKVIKQCTEELKI